MRLAALNLPRILLMVVSLVIAACSTTPAPSAPQAAAKPAPKKDYSALRIGGRETVTLPGIGTVHADKRMEVEDGVSFSGRVFLEIALPAAGDKPLFLYGYSERARCNTQGTILCLEGGAIVEGSRIVHQSTEANARICFDETGKMTTTGGHETLSY